MKITIIEYFILPKQTLIFRLIPNENYPQLIKLPIGREQLSMLIQNLRNSIIQLDSSYEEISHKLYSILINEIIIDLPKEVTHLVIIPHGELHHLSFIALWSGTEYLGQRFTVSQLPSLQTLHYINERPRSTNIPCLAVGTAPNDPMFIQRSFEGEATDVAQLFDVSPILGAEAHWDRIVPLLSNTNVLHFATHGRFVHQNPLHSGLKISPLPFSEKNSNQTERSKIKEVLMVRDFFKYGLNADLVVLSSCCTGLSKINPGDELEGFIQALLYAGTASVLCSLWEVDTVATREFMRAFYNSWKINGQSKAKAQQHACEHIRQLSLSQISEIIMRDFSKLNDIDQLRVHVELGDLYFRLNWLPEAKNHYTKALKFSTAMNLDIDSTLIKEYLGYILIGMGSNIESQTLLDDAQQVAKYLPLRTSLRGSVKKDLISTKPTPYTVSSDKKNPQSVRPWSAPYYWAPFILVGGWLK